MNTPLKATDATYKADISISISSSDKDWATNMVAQICREVERIRRATLDAPKKTSFSLKSAITETSASSNWD